MSAELLPCPWCVQRGERRLLGGGLVTIGCTWCGSTGPRAYGHDEARASWNANARFVSEAKTVLNDIADAIGDAGRLGESHGDTIRRLRAELEALRTPIPALPELPDGWSLDDQGVAVNAGGSVFIDKGGCVQIYNWASRAPIDVVLAVIARYHARFGGGS